MHAPLFITNHLKFEKEEWFTQLHTAAKLSNILHVKNQKSIM